MKTLQQITYTEVKKHTAIYSTLILVALMFIPQLGKSQDMVAETSLENIAVIQVQAADTLNPAFEANQTKVDSMMTLYFRGTDDADNNYKAKKSCKWLVFGASVIGTPVLGLIPAIITSSVHPSARNLNVPEGALLHNAAYMKGYKDEAHDIKKRAIWNHYLTGSSIWAVVLNVAII
ncbi:MAG TPA: hypothetical protein VK806_09140 [Bacteroidia bacterium]|jgi:hypothetical protein|nr:hypothetical protein [Bacteroidia bacterium]